jgi:hypothetical protein
MGKYYKRNWEESTGEERTYAWGTSTFFFETDDKRNIIRQIQIFEEGQLLKYEQEFPEDDFGFLSNAQLDEEEFAAFSISEKEFNNTWHTSERKTT